MTKYDYPVAATVVGLLLGSMAETSLIQVSQLTAGFRWQFISDRPIAMILFALIIIAFAYRPLKQLLQNRRNYKAQDPNIDAAPIDNQSDQSKAREFSDER